MTICPTCHKPITPDELEPGPDDCQCLIHFYVDGPDKPLAVPSEPIKFDPEATVPDREKPKIGQALHEAMQKAIYDRHFYLKEHGSLKADGPNAFAHLEQALCPLLANALTQPLQFDGLIEHFTAVHLVALDNDKGLHEAMRQTIATFVLMACGQMPWPDFDPTYVAPKPEAGTTGGASAS